MTTGKERVSLDRFKVRSLREKRGIISDEQLGKALGYSRSSIRNRWRDGWPWEDATELARVLCIVDEPTDEQLLSIVIKLMDDPQ